MKVNWYYIKMVVLAGLTVFLYGFSSKRNEAKTINGVKINFEAGDNLFITAAGIDKLMVQNDEHITRKERNELQLKELEERLTGNDMIAKAEVYLTIDGVVGVNVKQRKPVARVEDVTSYYIDENATAMPLSPSYSARVPVVNGVKKSEIAEVFPLIVYIKNDPMLHKQIIGITKENDGSYWLSPRVKDYKICLGKPADLESKFNNYKAFYQKALRDKSLETYRLVDLKFRGQVVGTKK